MRYVLNSAVIVRPGHYEYKLLTDLEAEVWFMQGRFVTRVGYLETAQFIEHRFGVRCPLSREPMIMQPGDEALVVRKYRMPEPPVKGHLERRAEDWEIGLLKRTA
jgi:hypothetical protein